MTTRIEAPQVVQVTGDCRLIDERRTEHAYWRRNGCGLPKGWYIATWPFGSFQGRFDISTEFRGPFHKREEALSTLQRAE